jgi:acetyl/propionyl-CoA carboxylase alpha subunit
VQIFADTHGNVVHLGERDCSLQRRHQKILESSPAPNLDAGVRERLHDAAVAFARRAGYVGAGTCEFLVAGDEAGFIEMNARLQVEHPVTEMVTGLDLVELQLRVALGEPLPVSQHDVLTNGHAIEVRVYAEDPDTGFLPQAGRVEHVRWPDDARVDTGIEEGTEVSPHYDPLLAKLIVRGHNRVAALWALHRALPRAQVLGVRTNLGFLNAVCQDPAVIEARVATDWLEQAYADWRSPEDPSAREVAIAVAAAAEAELILRGSNDADPWAHLGPWRAGREGEMRIVLRPLHERVVSVTGTGPFGVDGRCVLERGRGCHDWSVRGSAATASSASAARGGDRWFVWTHGDAYEIPVGIAERRLAGAGPARLDSPLPGQVIAVRVEAGQRVVESEELVVVEAMKMEHAIKAPTQGTVRAVLCAAGDQVERGQPLVDFEPA